MINPYKKGTRSWAIWERNNNPNNKDFWITLLHGKTRKEDEYKVQEALKHAV